MWQRVQTLYMFLASVVSILLILFFPIYNVGEVNFMAADNPVLLLFYGFIAGALLANIFNFKKRSLQIVLNRIILVANLVLIVFLIWVYLTTEGEVSLPGVSMYVPLLTMVLVVLANKGIHKDEKLIRSADRIR